MLCAISAFFLTGSAGAVNEWARARAVTLAANAGYRLDNLYVEGREYTDADVVRGIINMEKGDPLFDFDPQTARDLLTRVSWVKDVRVERQLPNTIYIEITERQPLALWQENGKVRVIDRDGVVLTNNIDAFPHLPLVVGPKANTQAADLLASLSAEPDLMKRIESATWIGTRRWDLALKGGVVVKLPEDNVGLALKKLVDTAANDQLLDKNIDLVDLREPDRLVVRTKNGEGVPLKAAYTPGGKDL